MKKLIFCLTMISFCPLIPKLQAQSAVGMKVGVNLSDFWVSESAQLESSSKAGFSLGNFFRCQLREYVGLEIDMMFRYQNSEMKDLVTGKTSDCYFLSFEIPVYSMLQAYIKQNMVYLGGGLFTSYGIISRFESGGSRIDPYKKYDTNSKTMLHRWNFGVGFIVGYELEIGLQFNINYHLGFRNVLDANSDRGAMIPKLMELGIGYRF